MLLSEAWKKYELDKKIDGYSPVTMKGYTLQCKLLIRGIGDVDIKDVTLEQLKLYLVEQKKIRNLKPSTTNHRQRFIRSLFHWAHAEGYIERNPAYKLREMKEPRSLPKAISEENLEILRESCKTPKEHAIIEIFFASGCRLGEIWKLNKRDINWEKRTFIVDGKGSKERQCYFSVKAAIWLKKYLKGRKDDCPALIATERRPYRRMSPERMREIIKDIAKRECPVNVFPHALRHTFATHMLDRGAPIELIQEYLGHTKIETTRIYCQLSGERKREYYNKFM